jgi:hypothetical protein
MKASPADFEELERRSGKDERIDLLQLRQQYCGTRPPSKAGTFTLAMKG